jgi:hypothetical protein
VTKVSPHPDLRGIAKGANGPEAKAKRKETCQGIKSVLK